MYLYVGHTGPKTQKLLEKALGKVLFIDEAYRLAEGQFATEAMDEIVDSLTKPKFAQKLIVILAGYDADINRLMSINPGLTSRFPESVVFKHLSPEQCLQLLIQLFKRKPLDITILEQPSDSFRQMILTYFEKLSSFPSWGNARDVQSLFKNIFGSTLKSASGSTSTFVLSEDVILESIKSMVSERARRMETFQRSRRSPSTNITTPILSATAPNISPEIHNTAQSTADTFQSCSQQDPGDQLPSETPKDSGVSDEVWQRLQEDIRAAEDRSRQYQQLISQETKLKEAIVLENNKAEVNQQVHDQRDNDSALNEEKRLREEARLKLERERRTREEELAELERKKKEMEEERRKEALRQTKLRQMGVCIAGYRWIKQSSGYRCAGGSHFVSSRDLDL